MRNREQQETQDQYWEAPKPDQSEDTTRSIEVKGGYERAASRQRDAEDLGALREEMGLPDPEKSPVLQVRDLFKEGLNRMRETEAKFRPLKPEERARIAKGLLRDAQAIDSTEAQIQYEQFLAEVNEEQKVETAPKMTNAELLERLRAISSKISPDYTFKGLLNDSRNDSYAIPIAVVEGKERELDDFLREQGYEIIEEEDESVNFPKPMTARRAKIDNRYAGGDVQYFYRIGVITQPSKAEKAA